MVVKGRESLLLPAVALACCLAGSCSSTGKKPEPAGDLGSANRSGSAGGNGLSAESTLWEFGSVKRGDTVNRTLVIRHEGGGVLTVSAHSSCECLTAELESQVLEPGEVTKLSLSFLGEDVKEKVTKTVHLYDGAPGSSPLIITVTGRVEPGDGPHIQCRPIPILFEKTGETYPTAVLGVINKGGAVLTVTGIRCFGCLASETAFAMGANERIEVEIGLIDGWSGNRWLEIDSNDPVWPTRKVPLIVMD